LKLFDRGKWGALLDETRRAINVLSEGRARRIEEIRSALRDGTYRVDGKQVAGKMVSDAIRELRERPRE
jgi:anti-sigma28 factor (negative regulator of flagellin synthesis)